VVLGTVRFETAWRIGTGREGQTMSDLGVLLDPAGLPVLPGSSLKGRLRGTCEALAHALGMTACLLDHAASGVACAGDVKLYSRRLRAEYRGVLADGAAAVGDRLSWIEANTCDVCKLFGSPVRAARLRCADGRLDPVSWAGVVQVRDGVVLDRDSHTAVDGLKYDYEVVPAGTAFAVRFDLEDPTDPQLALLGAALFEWHAGSSLGGFTSRGLGRFRLENVTVAGVDFAAGAERIKYLTQTDPDRRLTDRGDWAAFFSPRIERQAAARGQGRGREA
jgi:CRISPR-associated RAMP protein (TIGR02581 family)